MATFHVAEKMNTSPKGIPKSQINACAILARAHDQLSRVAVKADRTNMTLADHQLFFGFIDRAQQIIRLEIEQRGMDLEDCLLWTRTFDR